MTAASITFQVIIYALGLWLGLYLLARTPGHSRLRLAGCGVFCYALGWGFDLLSRFSPDSGTGAVLIRLRWSMAFLPALFWSGVMLYLLPEDSLLREKLLRLWRWGLAPAVMLCYFLGLFSDWLFDARSANPITGTGYILLVILVLLPLLATLTLAWRAVRLAQPNNLAGLLLLVLVMFGMSTGLLLVPLEWLPHPVALLLVDADLSLLCLAIAGLDAFDQGETFLPDFLRSLGFASFTALVFGGQIALVMIFSTGNTFPMLALLLATIATAIAVQTLYSRLESLLDRLAFARKPRIREARAELRAVADSLARTNPEVDFAAMPETEFTALVRRAISQLGNLPRLAASPLIYLPLIEQRLAGRGAGSDPLERAMELKGLLSESITRLKPRSGSSSGTTDEWRYYNSLYFPYVAGHKPYSRRAELRNPDPETLEILEWFRLNVPERTLHNWQNAAAKLVARDLLTKNGSIWQ